ncbi:hypothetical protein AB9H29_12150 [Stenotrophomonas sepilia]|uniref:hypothetical protein n=1 Tax=Stenotrophomonas sepilia TaxID=2860290 RepID=UPI0035573057
MMRLSLFAIAVLASATAQAGNWKPDSASGFRAASTMDKHGNQFGVTCKESGGACVWVIKTKKECRVAEQFDIKIITDGVPTPSKAQCFPREGKDPAFFAISNFDQIMQLIPLSKTLAFESDAQPLVNSGPFQVEDTDGVLARLAEDTK